MPKFPALSGCNADGLADVGAITSPEQEAIYSGYRQTQDLRSGSVSEFIYTFVTHWRDPPTLLLSFATL